MGKDISWSFSWRDFEGYYVSIISAKSLEEAKVKFTKQNPKVESVAIKKEVKR